MRAVAELVAERVRRFGPIRFDEFMQLALYHPEVGFYSRGRGAGRSADFLTSPSAGPLFGAVLARALDTWWHALGRPDPFVAIDAGAADASLARDVLAARPECAPALRYLLVEQSEALREAHASKLHLEPVGAALGPMSESEDGEGPQPVQGVGPLAASLAELPAEPVVGVVFANELLDNLPFRVLERASAGWLEVRVAEDLSELLVPASEEDALVASRFAPSAPEGGRIPLQQRAASWLRQALHTLVQGRVVVVDYADTTAGMAGRDWSTWLRTYTSHGPGDRPLSAVGEQDVTCDVAVDQLAAVRAPASNRSQAEFLRAHGLDTLVEDARERWRERAAIGDLDALKARSRVTESGALVDPHGLGAFRVLEWSVGPGSRPKRAR